MPAHTVLKLLTKTVWTSFLGQPVDDFMCINMEQKTFNYEINSCRFSVSTNQIDKDKVIYKKIVTVMKKTFLSFRDMHLMSIVTVSYNFLYH